MRVLSLDLSKRATGWACDSSEIAGLPISGTWRGPKMNPDLGATGHAFERWLFKHIKEHQIDHVIYEAPHVGNSGSGNNRLFFNEETVLVLIGLAFATETIGFAAHVSRSRGHVGTWRKFFLGSARWDNPKQAAKDRCDLLGWKYDSEDAAEALGLWYYCKCQLDPTFNTIPKPKVIRA